jgi:hypothetical protein
MEGLRRIETALENIFVYHIVATIMPLGIFLAWDKNAGRSNGQNII